jgi:hypothetical protein
MRRLSVLLVPFLLTACPGSDDDPPAGPKEGTLVVGVQTTADITALVGSVHVVAKVDDVVQKDEIVPIAQLPKEIELKGTPSSKADVVVDAFGPGPAAADASGTPMITRRATTGLVTDAKKLLRIQLDARCMTLAGGGPVAPVCNAPDTCLSGACRPSAVAFDDLEDYEPAWPTSPPDFCRPAKHGAPEVVLGDGQTDYSTLNDGDVLQLEKGPQGGHHIWVALRMKNLRQSGSTTMISSEVEGDPAPVPPMAYVFTFDRDEGNYCKLYGLRYQVDSGVTDLTQGYRRFLGKRLKVTVKVTDTTGASGESTRTIQLSDKLLCPDGTDKCNTTQ